MRKILIILSGFLSLQVYAQTLVSGLDDVLRQAENTSFMKSALKMMEEDKAYSGMNRLYGLILKRTGKENFIILSAMPTWFEGRVEDFLRENQFPPSELRLRNIWWNWRITNFKMNQIAEVMEEDSEGIILVLDNSEASLDFVKTAKKQYGKKIQKVYVRETVKKEYPDFITPYVTTFDIALSELKSGRVSKRDVEQVLIDLVTETDEQKLIPEYSYCPVTYDPCQDGIFANCHRLSYRIRAICRGREGAEKEKK